MMVKGRLCIFQAAWVQMLPLTFASCTTKVRARYRSYLTCNNQFSSVAQSCPTLCDPMGCSTPGFPVHHQLLEPAQTQAHPVGDAIQPSRPLPSPSPPAAFNLSQRQGLFQRVSSSRRVAKVLELQLQQQSFRRIFGADFLYD